MTTPDQKHPCPDCRQCQWCSDDRCRLCLRSAAGCRKKLSMAEQIALYEQLNSSGTKPGPDRDPRDCTDFCLENLAKQLE